MASPDQLEIPGTRTADRRAGLAFAVLAAASAALLLVLPVMVLGYTISVLDSVIAGEQVAWQSVVLMSYALAGIPALLSLFLLVIPRALFRATGRRLGTRQAVAWVGGLLVVWHTGVAAIWAWEASSGFSRAPVGDGLSYPIAFGAAAAAMLLGRALAARPTEGTRLLRGRRSDGPEDERTWIHVPDGLSPLIVRAAPHALGWVRDPATAIPERRELP